MTYQVIVKYRDGSQTFNCESENGAWAKADYEGAWENTRNVTILNSSGKVIAESEGDFEVFRNM